MKRFLICATVLALIACASFADACGRRGRSGCGGGGCDGDDGGAQFSAGGCQSCGQQQFVPMSRVAFRNMLNTDLFGNCNCNGNCPQDCATNNCNCSVYGASATPGMLKLQACRSWGKCDLVDVPVTGAGTTWQSFPDFTDANLFGLFFQGKQIGTWNAAERWYAPYDAAARTFAAKQYWNATAQQKPTTVPTSTDAADPFAQQGIGGASTVETSTKDPQPTFGANWPSGSPNAESSVGANAGANSTEVPADALLPFAGITAGDPALREKFRQAWDSEALRPWRGRWRIKAYATGDPMLKDRDGKEKWFAAPGLYFEDKDGAALGDMSIEDFQADPAGMLVYALNQVDPQFDPSQVRNLALPPEPESISDQFADAWPTISKILFTLALAVTAVFACVYAFQSSNRGSNDLPAAPAAFAADVY